jgi:hypothetical protein
VTHESEFQHVPKDGRRQAAALESALNRGKRNWLFMAFNFLDQERLKEELFVAGCNRVGSRLPNANQCVLLDERVLTFVVL